ncbi:MAG: hypothetical protein ACK8QZ_08555, partial [Anaerolineales bacterium]
MNLLQQATSLIAWTFTVVKRLLGVRRTLTGLAILSSFVARITRMLTFMLPLKVILLAGSEGVPRYFQIFVSPDMRDEWVIGLSLGAMICYALTLLLESQVGRLSGKGSEAVTAASDVMTVVPNQREQAKEFYERFISITSGILFVLSGLALLSVLNLVLLGFLVGAGFLALLIAAWASSRLDPLVR